MLPQITNIIKHHIRNGANFETDVEFFAEVNHPRKYLYLQPVTYSLGPQNYRILNIVAVFFVGFAAVEVTRQPLPAVALILDQQILLRLDDLLGVSANLRSDVLLINEIEPADELRDPRVI